MSFLEQQAELGRRLFDINLAATSKLIKTQQEGMLAWLESNAEYGRRLPEVKDVSSAMEVSREYSETLWSNFRASTEAQAGIVRNAIEEAGEVVRASLMPARPENEAAA